MKKADITKATSNFDTCAIFEVARGDSSWKRYARLMTEQEKNKQSEGRISYRRTAPSVSIVYVNAIHADKQTSSSPSAYAEDVVTDFVDAQNHYGRTDAETVPLARIKRCVNETQSFVDFFNAEIVAKKNEVKRQKQAKKQAEQAAINHANRISDLNERITELGFDDRRSVSTSYGSYNREVSISVETLTELVRLAEQAKMTDKVGA
jgi:hypothetical protein